ncbi:MAG: ABC-type uncharacterized transport system ATPase subunit [Candidatus Poriferisodalaceae bacterium]
MNSAALIRLSGISKAYVVWTRAGRVRGTRTEVPAVTDVSFEIHEGEMVGYLGPNRA